jgi:hypothetical protein
MVGPGAALGSRSPALISPGKKGPAVMNTVIIANTNIDLRCLLIFPYLLSMLIK